MVQKVNEQLEQQLNSNINKQTWDLPVQRIQELRDVLNRGDHLKRTFTIRNQYYTYLRDLSTSQLDGAKHTATDGTSIWYPDGAGGYPYLWTRDVAYMIDGRPDYFSASQVEAVFNYIASKVSSSYAVPDHIGQDGTVYWTPGNSNNWGSRAPVDGNACLVDIAWQYYRKTGDAKIYKNNKQFLQNVLNKGVPYSSTGCVTISDSSPFVGYGFCDTVKMTGDVLFPSAMMYKAYLQLADMAYESGDLIDAIDCIKRADSIKSGVQTTLWNGVIYNSPGSPYNGPLGFFKASTGKCSGQDDLWGSAFAVWVGLASDEQALAIAKNFEANFGVSGGYHSEGGIRHVLKSNDYIASTQVWEAYYVTPTYGQYQSGGYWPTPIPWVCYTLSLCNPDRARALMDSMFTRFRADGSNTPYEWWNGASVGVAKYVSSATLPMLILEREQHGIYEQIKNSASTGIPTGYQDVTVTFDTPFTNKCMMASVSIVSTTTLALHWFTFKVMSQSTTGVTVRVYNDGGGAEGGLVCQVQAIGY